MWTMGAIVVVIVIPASFVVFSVWYYFDGHKKGDGQK